MSAVLYVDIQCCVCGVQFGIPDGVAEVYRQTEQSFYCPHGHGQHLNRPKEQRKEERPSAVLHLVKPDDAA